VADSAGFGRLLSILFPVLAGTSLALARRMPIVHCDQRLWRVVRTWTRLSQTPGRSDHGALGDWGGTVIKGESQTIIVIVNLATYLTAVFSVCPGSAFVAAFKAALRASLEDLSVDASTIALETTLLEGVELKRMPRSEFSDVLEYVKDSCEIELMYHTDLRRVQRNLNELPHATGVPAAIVSALFERGSGYSAH
jgi:hypothetical protein